MFQGHLVVSVVPLPQRLCFSAVDHTWANGCPGNLLTVQLQQMLFGDWMGKKETLAGTDQLLMYVPSSVNTGILNVLCYSPLGILSSAERAAGDSRPCLEKPWVRTRRKQTPASARQACR